MALVTLSEKEYARERLKELIRPGDTVFTILRHVSRSGMSRVIDVVVFKDNHVFNIGSLVAKFLGYAYDAKREGVKVDGAGMDMGFWLIYNLSLALFDNGLALEHRWL